MAVPVTRRIRVLFVIGTMSGGGAERQILEHLRLIDRARFEPMLYLATRTGELLSLVPDDVPTFACRDDRPERFGQKIARCIKLSPLIRYWHLAGVLRREQIDVLYDRTYHATLDAAGATWFRPTPRIACCVVDPQPELELHSRSRSSFVWWIARAAYRRASLVLANSSDLRQRVIDYFRLAPDRVVTCHNLIDLEQLDQEIDEPITEHSNTAFLLVAAGRLHPQKGYRYLLEAIDELVNRRGRRLNLMLFGTGDLETELHAFVRDHHLELNVTFGGFTTKLHSWFRHAQLFVLPSLYEGLPNSLLEAVACGTPALATDCPSGPREILEDGRLGQLVPPADSLALANAIQAAMDHYPEWKQRAMMARDSVRRRYDAKTGIREFERFVEQVARNIKHL